MASDNIVYLGLAAIAGYFIYENYFSTPTTAAGATATATAQASSSTPTSSVLSTQQAQAILNAANQPSIGANAGSSSGAGAVKCPPVPPCAYGSVPTINSSGCSVAPCITLYATPYGGQTIVNGKIVGFDGGPILSDGPMGPGVGAGGYLTPQGLVGLPLRFPRAAPKTWGQSNGIPIAPVAVQRVKLDPRMAARMKYVRLLQAS